MRRFVRTIVALLAVVMVAALGVSVVGVSPASATEICHEPTITDSGECESSDFGTPQVSVGTICEIDMATAVVMVDHTMIPVAMLYKVALSNGKTAERLFEPNTEGEILVSFEGEVSITVTVVYDGVIRLEFIEQLTSANCGGSETPVVVLEPKAQLAGAVCVAEGEGSVRAALDNSASFVLNPMPNTDDMSAAEVPYTVTSSAGFAQTVVVAAGQVEYFDIPLVEDESVVVTITALDTVLATEEFTSNCSETDIDTPVVVVVDPGPAVPMLAESGASTGIMLFGGLAAIVIGWLAFFFSRRIGA